MPKPPPIKTDKEKEELRRKLKDKYEVKFDIPERILYMALESVLYDEEQANNLMWEVVVVPYIITFLNPNAFFASKAVWPDLANFESSKLQYILLQK